MSDLIKFNWWDNDNAPPENFKTKKQLSEMGLSPKKPRAVIHTNKYDLLLFDINDNESVKPKKILTEKQLKSLEINHEKQRFIRFLKNNFDYYNDQIEAGKKAYDLLLNGFLIISFNTTDLSDFKTSPAGLTNISIINHRKEILLNQLINPQRTIDKEAFLIDNIEQEKVNQCKAFPFFYDEIKRLLKDNIIIFWSEFHCKILQLNCDRYSLPRFKFKEFLLLQKEYTFFHEGREFNYNYDYELIPLESPDPSALGKAFAVYSKLTEIAQAFNLNIVDKYDIKSNLVNRDMLVNWYEEKYPDYPLPALKDSDLMLGNCYLCPDNYSVMLSPNSK